MGDVTLSPQTIALVGGLMSALVVAISVLSGTVALLYRQVLKERDRTLDMQARVLAERDRVLEERDARMVDIWREMEEKEIRITALEGANDRWQKLASEATAGWKASVEDARTRMP